MSVTNSIIHTNHTNQRVADIKLFIEARLGHRLDIQTFIETRTRHKVSRDSTSYTDSH